MSRTIRKGADHARHSTFEGYYAAHWHEAELRHRRFCRLFGKIFDPKAFEAEARRHWVKARRDGQRESHGTYRGICVYDAICRATAAGHVRREARRQIRRGLRDGDWDGLVFPGKRDGKAHAILDDYW